MIDTDKMRAAYAATPLCQNQWTKKEGNNPTMLCAVSALVSFAGVQPDLIHKMNEVLPPDLWVRDFACPVLMAEYGMPRHVVAAIPRIFDRQENEWRGVEEVLALCERHNMDELHGEALAEDRVRFPQHVKHTYSTGELVFRFELLDGSFTDAFFKQMEAPMPALLTPPAFAEPKGQTATGKSKFWTAPKAPAVPKKYAGKLTV